MCSFIAKIQKKAVVAQSLVVPSLKLMVCINIQALEKEFESFPVVVEQGMEVQHCKLLSCPASAAASEMVQCSPNILPEVPTVLHTFAPHTVFMEKKNLKK